ncbi:MAG: trypsin-like peptidase domain-containing protein [Myxococcota bacterium]|nr:trypsin-like peptidase domain-containing protein [Myxococcota bacterium]
MAVTKASMQWLIGAVVFTCVLGLTQGCRGKNSLFGQGLTAQEETTIALFSEASPSVVSITPLSVFRDAMSMNLNALPQGMGSGFIWNSNGIIVTNMHVISGADALQVTLHDQSTWPAQVIGVAPDTDLAVLRVQAPSRALKPIDLGRSGDLRVGQRVLAIGNPYGLDHSLTVGVVSSLDRSIESLTGRDIRGVIQTDASINPGNSGGPLLDSQGRLVGVNTAIRSPSGGSAGIGFAVPVDTVKRIVPQLIRYGRIMRPRLGVHIASPQVAQKLGVNGLLVLSVDRQGPAGRAGVRGTRRGQNGQLVLGDIIVSLDGVSVPTTDALMERLELIKPTGQARLGIKRGHDLTAIDLRFAPRASHRP